jgi:tetratricopeptide (TPR) repeat protein
MKDRLEVTDSKNLSGYVNTMKDNIKRRYNHYKISKLRESYREGLLFEECADYKQAIRKYLECLDMEPGNLKTLRRLANLYSNLDEHVNALDLYSKIVKLNPDEETYFQLAQEFYKQNRFKKAIKCLTKSLYYKKRFINSHILLATIYAKADNVDKTEQYLTNVIKIDPHHKASLEELLKFYYKQGRYRDSLKILTKYNSQYAEDSSIKIIKSDLYIKTGRYAQALKILSQVTTSDDRFNNFTKEMQYKKINPTAREKEFINRITAIKNKKLVSFESNLQDYYNGKDCILPNPKEAYDLSILYLLIGNQKKSLKYLLFARQLNEESKYS